MYKGWLLLAGLLAVLLNVTDCFVDDLYAMLCHAMRAMLMPDDMINAVYVYFIL